MSELQRRIAIKSDAADEGRDHELNSPHDPWLEDEIAFNYYIRAVFLRRKLLVAGALIGALLAFGVATIINPAVYEAVTTFLIVSPPGATAVTQTNATTEMFTAILQNSSLAAQVITELGLGQSPHNLTPEKFVQHALAVQSVAGTNVVRLKVSLRDPVLAAEACRRLAKKALTLSHQLLDQEGSTIQSQLKTHLEDAATRLRAAEQGLLAYQQQAQVELLKEDTQVMLEQRGDLLKLVIQIEGEKARLSSAVEEIKRQQPLLSVGRSVGAEEALRRESPTSSARGLDLTNPFINPVYQTLDFEISTSRTRLAALEQQRRQLLSVEKVGGTELAKLSELYRRQIEQARLQTNLDLARRVFVDLSLRYEQSRTEALGKSPQLQLVDEALAPEDVVSRKRVQFAALGLAAGFAVAALVALVLVGRRPRTARNANSGASR